MPGISPKLPLSTAKPEITYVNNKNLRESIQQNIKNLILTSPGEKVFDANFGAGIRRLLFENVSNDISSEVVRKISSQVEEYMSFIRIENLVANFDPDNNKLYVTFAYSVPTLSLADTLSLEIPRNNYL
jgi:phage baseplate assembly protein W